MSRRRQHRSLVHAARVSILLACAIVAAAYTSIGHGAPAELSLGGARLQVTLEGGPFRIGSERLVEWVRRSAAIVGGYYAGFPVASLHVRINAVDGGGVRGGRAFAESAPEIHVSVGREVSEHDLIRDWVLVHEMTHLALPEVGRKRAWLAEGIATYVEGIARVQAGNMTAAELWDEDVVSMPKGLPAAGDQGLDRTHTWARTYWGGALFCLAADVSIRERTANRFGLQDALRAVAHESGGMVSAWPVEQVFRAGDAATGTSVLAELYAGMRDQASAPDLPMLWRRLGLSLTGEHARLLSGTSEAALREAITRAPPPATAPSQ